MAIKEYQYYKPLMASIMECFRTKVEDTHFEITANGRFTNDLKSAIPTNRDIIFRFLRSSSPDITGFIKHEFNTDFIVVEFKTHYIKLPDIYQARRYSDLFQAKFTFLVSLHPVPEEIIRLHKVTFGLLEFSALHREFTLLRFNPTDKELVDWYPRNPFEIDFLWS